MAASARRCRRVADQAVGAGWASIILRRSMRHAVVHHAVLDVAVRRRRRACLLLSFRSMPSGRASSRNFRMLPVGSVVAPRRSPSAWLLRNDAALGPRRRAAASCGCGAARPRRRMRRRRHSDGRRTQCHKYCLVAGGSDGSPTLPPVSCGCDATDTTISSRSSHICSRPSHICSRLNHICSRPSREAVA